MRVALVLILIAAPLVLTAMPVEATPRSYFASYVAHPLLAPRVVGPNTGAEPGLGGVVFPSHPHATTANVVVTDNLNGAIPAFICQDLNDNLACDAFPGGGDSYACMPTGTISGFPIAATSAGDPNRTTVYVMLNGFRLEVCNMNGRATTGTIGLTYTS